MALPIVGALAGGVATAMYMNAKYLLWNDLKSGTLSARTSDAVQFVAERYTSQRMLIYHFIEEHAKGSRSKNVFLVFEGREWTYAQFYADLQRVGNWLMNDLGIKQKEIVAIDGGNTPEYLMLWFGLDAIGACPAFINCNLTSQPLVHSVKLSGCGFLIAESERMHLIQPVQAELEAANIKVVYYDPPFFARLSDTTPIPPTRGMGIKPGDLKGLIYTSGTTGLPKGVIAQTGRELILARATARYLQLKPGDRMYTTLPLYHGAGHTLCATPCIYAGATIVLSRKFSHKTFWPEVRASKANIIQYVGELCRYLVNAPLDPLDKVHNVKMAWGNGMRPDVWEVFRQRFGIEIINELYAATDGMGATFNANRGEFGRNAIAIRGLYWNLTNGSNEKRVQIDPDTQEILRDPQTRFARACKLGEAGEVIHKMDPATVSTTFSGYYGNKAATQKRFITDVFKKGDLWFRSGDMMRQDPDGCVYFVDRLGDTFRWHSENVSTNEVGDILGQFPQIIESTVYGVQVPHADGRAGMAAVVLVNGVTESQFQLEEVAQHLISRLPRYAVPIFLRVVEALDYTETNKIKKGKLREEGIDVLRIEGNLKSEGRNGTTYWLPPGTQKYVPYAQEDWEEIKAGRVRL